MEITFFLKALSLSPSISAEIYGTNVLWGFYWYNFVEIYYMWVIKVKLP